MKTPTAAFTVRQASGRGQTRIDWLDSQHTFSFGDYADAAHRGFGVLRVLNDDRVKPGAGFPRHFHRDMEIVTYVLEGALAHQDSTGTGAVIRPGDVQRMSAGSGIEHSEFNASKTDPVHFLQIWIVPAARGIPPSYEQKAFSVDDLQGHLRVVASPDGADGSVTIHQDVRIFAGRLVSGDSTVHRIPNGRSAWLQVARGNVTLDGTALSEGDGVAITEASSLRLEASAPSEALLFELPTVVVQGVDG